MLPLYCLKQDGINIKVKEELGHLLIIEAADCDEMFFLAVYFDTL